MQKILLDKNWSFMESEFVGKRPGFAGKRSGMEWKTVTLPHDRSVEKERCERSPSGAKEGFMQATGLYYKREMILSEDVEGKQVWLEFEGIAGLTQVWVNGCFAMKHNNPYTGFLADITVFVKPGANEIIVFTDNRAKPNSRWYTGTGIYRHVWLHVGEPVAVRPYTFKITTMSLNGGNASLSVSAALTASDKCDVTCKVLDHDGSVIACCSQSNCTGRFDTEIALAGITPWCPETPCLYTVQLDVMANGATDTAECRTGIRVIEADSKNGFRLNGKLMKLRGGCVHHDLGILGAASHDAAERRKVKLLMDNGFNALRFAHNPYSPSIFDACDEMGMLVIEEAFDEWVLGRTSFGHYSVFESDWEKDLEDMINRDYNHPCIVIWSTGNEVDERDGSADGYAWSRRLADKVRMLDASRPTSVTACVLPAEYQQKPADSSLEGNQALNMVYGGSANSVDIWGDATEQFYAPVDIAGYNYKIDRYADDAGKYPDRVIYGSETHPLLAFESWQATLDNPNVFGDFVWTAMDYIGESGIGSYTVEENTPRRAGWPWLTAHCGDLDLIGSKRPQSYYRDVVWQLDNTPRLFVLPPELTGKQIKRAYWTWDPVEPCYTFPDCDGQNIEAHVYANADEVELFQNGESLGRKPTGAEQKRRAVYELEYNPGKLEVVAYINGMETGRDCLSTLGKTVRLELLPDSRSIKADGIDLCFVTLRAFDENGLPAYLENSNVMLSSSGGELLAFGNADPKPDRDMPFKGNTSPLYHGEAMAVIRSEEGTPGVTIKALSGFGASANLTLDVIPANTKEVRFISSL